MTNKEKTMSPELKKALRTVGLIIASVIIALFIGSVFCIVVGKNPVEAYEYLLIKPYSTLLGVGEVMAKLTPLVIVGVGVAFAALGGCNNLGGEGQMYVGALGAILIAASSFGQSLGVWAVPLGMLAGAFFGVLWGGFAGFMKAYYGSNELIVTLLLNYIAVQLIAYLVHGPIMEYGGVNPQSEAIDPSMELAKLWSGTRAHVGFFIMLLCLLLYWFVTKYTVFGYNLRIVGSSPKAAAYAGCNVKKYRLIAMILAGSFAGLAGSIEIFGVQHRLLEGICGSMGVTGMVIALIGQKKAVGILLAGIMMAGLSVGAERMQVSVGVPMTLVDVLQGLIVLFILVSMSFQTFQKIKRSRKKPAQIGEGATKC